MSLTLIAKALDFGVVIVDILGVKIAWFALLFVHLKQVVRNIEHCERLCTIFLTF